MTNITFRPIEASDYKALEKLISDTWNYERFCSHKCAVSLGKLYLASCLTNQNYTCVALKDNEPVGIIMGRNNKKKHFALRYYWRQFTAIATMLMQKEGRKVLKLFEGFDKINTNLIAERKNDFDGELAFFAIRCDMRGSGIGKELFGRVKSFMKSQNIENFYLFTDTTCNYGFYEHQGMKRINQKSCTVKAYGDQEMSFFLYAM